MAKRTRKLELVHRREPMSLGEKIHDAVRKAIEQTIDEELEAALGAHRYQRIEARRGHRNGKKTRTISGPTGPVELEVPRARIFNRDGEAEWLSRTLPRYERRLPEINAAVVATYLSGGNTRRLRGALRPLLKDTPLSKSAVSRIVGTLRSSLDEWTKRSLEDLDVVYVYLDAMMLRVRSARKVVSLPVLCALAVLADGRKQLLSLEMCGSESHRAWKGFLDNLVARGLPAPLLCIIDGNAGLRSAVGDVWPTAKVQRCTVHKLRNLERKAPKHAVDEIKEDYNRIVYAKSEEAARKAYVAFEKKWEKLCAPVVASLREAGDELLTYFSFPPAQWKTLRTTNPIERLNGEFRRRVKTQASLPNEEAGLVLLFGLVASGQIKYRRIDGWRAMSIVLSRRLRAAA